MGKEKLVENRIVVGGVKYVIKSSRKLSPEAMADAVNYREATEEPAKRGETIVVLYSPQLAQTPLKPG